MKKTLLITQLTALLVMFGCGKETLQDTATRQLDLNNETSTVLKQQYSVIQGQYVTSKNLDQSPYYVTMNLKVMSVYQDGVSTPVPKIVGNIVVSIKGKNGVKIDPISFSFNNGNYDQSTGTLALKVPGINTEGIQISCSNTNTSMLYCSWLPSASRAEQFDLILERVN